MSIASLTSRLRPGRRILLFLAALSVVATVAFITADGSDELVTSTPSLTQKFTDVSSEKMLLDFCYQLQTLHGVTGVSYRDFSPASRSAISVSLAELTASSSRDRRFPALA